MPRKPVTGVKFYQKDVSTKHTVQFLDRKKLDLKRNSQTIMHSSVGSHTNRSSGVRTSNGDRPNFMKNRNNFKMNIQDHEQQQFLGHDVAKFPMIRSEKEELFQRNVN